MSERRRVYSGSPWEQQVGYCRAIRVGNRIEVSGTTAVIDGEIVGIGDAYQQPIIIMKIIEKALKDLGGNLTDMVRMRIFITDPANVPDLMRAAQDFGLKEIQPAATLVVVNALIDPRLLVEIEADAIVGD